MKYTVLLIITLSLAACHTRTKQANKRGLEYMKQERYDQAIAEFNDILQHDAYWYPAYYNRAVAKMALSQWDDASSDLRIASRLGYAPAQEALVKYFGN